MSLEETKAVHCYIPTVPTAKTLGIAEPRPRREAVRVFKLRDARYFVNRLTFRNRVSYI